MKRFCLIFILISTVFFTFIFYSYAVNQTQLRLIPYWYATEDLRSGEFLMYRQALYPEVYSAVIGGGFSENDFDNYTHIARTRWSTAGMPSDSISTVSGSTIKVYGGPRASLVAIDPKINEPVNGNFPIALTLFASKDNEGQWGYDPNNTGEWGHGIQYKDGYRCFNTYVTFPYNSNFTFTENTKVLSHEFGHVFGWYGHSSSSSDLMYTTGNSSGIPTTRDINHVKQIYDLVGYSYSIS